MDEIEPENLPEPLRAMAPAAQVRYLEQAAETRQQLQLEISELAQQRSDFLKKKVEAAGGAGDSLDAKIYGAVRAQTADKGLSYEADAPSY